MLVKLYTKKSNIITRDKTLSLLNRVYTFIARDNIWVDKTKLTEYQNRFGRVVVAPAARPVPTQPLRQTQSPRVVGSRRVAPVSIPVARTHPAPVVNEKIIYINRYGVSEGSQALKDYLQSQGIKVKFYRGETLTHNHLILNWGKPSTTISGTPKYHIKNDIPTVNKIRTFEYLNSHNINTVEWTTNKEEAKAWFDENSEAVVYCRTVIDGQEGSGIVVAQSKDEVVDAPLYSKRFKGIEFRCFFICGRLVHTTQKRALNEESRRERGIELNEFVRNTNGAWIFSINPDRDRADSINYYFDEHPIETFTGAVDLICNNRGEVKILELNSSPGLMPVEFRRGERVEGTTTVKLGNELIKIFEEQFQITV